jgi:conjugal transfer pilus assembly protein TraV
MKSFFYIFFNCFRCLNFFRVFNILKIAFFITFLSGCAGMGSKFDCNVSSGGKCASMNHINKMVDQGAFNDSQTDKNKLIQTKYKQRYLSNSFEGAPIRSNESIQQIWIAPYEDANGNYHEPSYVYSVVKNGSWIGEPAGVIQD